MPIKVLLDTDIGSDIDDAVCLAYLLAQPGCDLLGITTVTGEADKRAALASALCKLADKNIPIFPGAEEPLLVPPKQTSAPQSVALERWAHDINFHRGQAVEFLRQTIHKHPGEIVLLAIGPLTNVALLFAVDQAIPSLLRGLVLMCGVFAQPEPGGRLVEWNAMLDPHAAAIVFKSAVRLHRSVGLDVTRKVTMSARQARERFTHPLLRPVLDFAEVWFHQYDTLTFHDPLAATTIFEDRMCAFEKGTVEVEVVNRDLLGKTYWRPATSDARHEVAVEVDKELFFEHYFSVFE